MYQACIAVVDAMRARLFSFKRTSEADGLNESFIEERDLVNPAHRGAQVAAIDAEFARLVATEMHALMQSAHSKRLILCAGPHMLGALRTAEREVAQPGVQIDELPLDLAKLSPSQLREHLASHGLLPELHRLVEHR
ncbi:hypothetical protein BH11MYX2_BH11MYX2_08570 [soil metagenome]